MRQYTPSEVEKLIKEEVEVSLESLLRTRARRLLQAALEWEVEEYIQRFKHELLPLPRNATCAPTGTV